MPQTQARSIPILTIVCEPALTASVRQPLGIHDHGNGIIVIGYPEVWGDWPEDISSYPEIIGYDMNNHASRMRAHAEARDHLNAFQAELIDAINPDHLIVF